MATGPWMHIMFCKELFGLRVVPYAGRNPYWRVVKPRPLSNHQILDGETLFCFCLAQLVDMRWARSAGLPRKTDHEQ